MIVKFSSPTVFTIGNPYGFECNLEKNCTGIGQ